jgi:hypothetical protein
MITDGCSKNYQSYDWGSALTVLQIRAGETVVSGSRLFFDTELVHYISCKGIEPVIDRT